MMVLCCYVIVDVTLCDCGRCYIKLCDCGLCDVTLCRFAS
jgi:hypothetical protein